MHDALHLRAQSLQLIHFSVSITGFKSEKRDNKPRTVPTGHIVLQYVRPLRQAKMAMMIKVTTATAKVDMLRITTSVL
jgi:hypothetical protein